MPAGAVANQVHCLWRWDGDGVSRHLDLAGLDRGLGGAVGRVEGVGEEAGQLQGHPFAGRGSLVARWIRASMRVLTIIPLVPRVISRGSAVCRPNVSQQVSSPRMSSHVPEEMPVGRGVR